MCWTPAGNREVLYASCFAAQNSTHNVLRATRKYYSQKGFQFLKKLPDGKRFSLHIYKTAKKTTTLPPSPSFCGTFTCYTKVRCPELGISSSQIYTTPRKPSNDWLDRKQYEFFSLFEIRIYDSAQAEDLYSLAGSTAFVSCYGKKSVKGSCVKLTRLCSDESG